MICPECQFDNREGAKFCKKCGAKLELACPKCNSVLTADSIFCDECGYDLCKPVKDPPIDYSQPQFYTPKFLAEKILTTRSSIEGERKLVTVFFADVANYTSMSEKLDPEEMHEIMDECFKILMDEIHKYEGTINQFTGDGVMALFGAPLAHEDHAQRACHAALSIQKTLENYSEKIEQDYDLEFKMRIGLNSGPVVVASIGDDLRMDYTAVGDTTNLAARMESKAEPGKILVSYATRNLVKDFFELNPLGKVEVKGKEHPQEVYELIKAGEVETRIKASVAKGLTKFVGRKNSMTALREPFERMLSGSGQVVGIVGEAGVGKSRFLLEFINQLPKGEYTYLEGRCLHYGSGMAYLPILDLVRSYFEIKEDDQELVIKNKLKEKIGQLEQRLSASLSPFQELLSVEVDDEKYLQLDPGQKKIRTFEAIRDLFLRESEQKPLVLAIEDLHWIDKSSEDCISYLIDWLANARILLILLYRLEYNHQWGSKSHYTKIGLTPLRADSSRKLVQAILEGGEVAPELKELIFNRSGGNPLFLEEFTHNLLEKGLVDRKGHKFVLTCRVSDIQVPDSIQGIITSRIDRVEENLKRVIQVASVIGREFALCILQSIMDMQEELKSHLLNLQGLEFISKKRLFPELEYIFKHALIQEVAYNSLLKKRRKEIHEKIGTAIETLYPDRLEAYYELLAYHYMRGENKEKAIKYLELANQKASKLNAMEEAKAYFDEAMQLLNTLPKTKENRLRRISLLVNNVIVFQLLWKFPEYYELLKMNESMAVELENPKLLGALYARLGHLEWAFGMLDQSIETETKAVEINEACGNAVDAGYAYMILQWDYLLKGDYGLVIKYKDSAVRMMERQFNLRWYLWAIAATSLAHTFCGCWDDAVEEGQKELKVAEEYSDNSMICFAHWNLSTAYAHKGDLDQAVEHAQISLDIAPTPADRVWAQVPLCLAWFRAGKAHKAINIMPELISTQRAARFTWSELTAVYLGRGYVLAGEFENAKQTLEEVLELQKQYGMKFVIGSAYRLLGEIDLHFNTMEAFSNFEKSITILTEIKAENELALAYAGYGRLYRQQGNIEKAMEYLNQALETFERLGSLIEPEKIREELAELPET